MTAKALTLHQPWASLIVAGIKTIETRSRRMNYRGRLYVHAAKREPVEVAGWRISADLQSRDGGWHATDVGVRTFLPLPLGAVVGHVDVVDCLPIIGDFSDPEPVPRVDFGIDEEGEPVAWEVTADGYNAITDQLPYGDFAPGRWAILLENPVRYDEPIPAKGKQGLWAWTRFTSGSEM